MMASTHHVFHSAQGAGHKSQAGEKTCTGMHGWERLERLERVTVRTQRAFLEQMRARRGKRNCGNVRAAREIKTLSFGQQALAAASRMAARRDERAAKSRYGRVAKSLALVFASFGLLSRLRDTEPRPSQAAPIA